MTGYKYSFQTQPAAWLCQSVLRESYVSYQRRSLVPIPAACDKNTLVIFAWKLGASNSSWNPVPLRQLPTILNFGNWSFSWHRRAPLALTATIFSQLKAPAIPAQLTDLRLVHNRVLLFWHPLFSSRTLEI